MLRVFEVGFLYLVVVRSILVIMVFGNSGFRRGLLVVMDSGYFYLNNVFKWLGILK